VTFKVAKIITEKKGEAPVENDVMTSARIKASGSIVLFFKSF